MLMRNLFAVANLVGLLVRLAVICHIYRIALEVHFMGVNRHISYRSIFKVVYVRSSYYKFQLL